VRLDHLLSKEHHEKSEASGLARAVRSRWPVVGAGLVHNNESSLSSKAARRQTHCWVLRQHRVVLAVGLGGGVASSWWWGVVFVYWIVVASI